MLIGCDHGDGDLDTATVMRLHVITALRAASFPAGAATINAALQFHPDARVSALTGAGTADELNGAQRRLLASSDRVSLITSTDGPLTTDADRRGGQALVRLAEGRQDDVAVWLEPGSILCAPVDDVAHACLRHGRVIADDNDDPAIIATPCRGSRESGAPLVTTLAHSAPVETRLDSQLWSPRDRHWRTIIDFRNGAFTNLSAGTRQRMFCSTPGFWTQPHRERVLGDHALQTYPYVWFLAMLWFGPCVNWSDDPHDYLPEGSRHLFDDLIACLPQIVQVLPRARYEWNSVSRAMIDRALVGVRRMLSMDDGMRDVIALVDLHPWIRRYVEVGSYEGGSILTLGLRFMVRDLDFYAVESFTGSLDGTTDGAALPSRRRFLESLSRFPSCRIHLVPGDSDHAATLFDDASVDCVFIDACHSTAAVLRDIDAWLPKLRRPGIIAGDDYSFDSVFAAVGARFDQVHVTPGGTIWWVALP